MIRDLPNRRFIVEEVFLQKNFSLENFILEDFSQSIVIFDELLLTSTIDKLIVDDIS